MLSEIEQKVVYLLEDCKDRPASDSPSLQEEAETLSLRLRDVKLNLEKVQGMLQDKHAEGKVKQNHNKLVCFFYIFRKRVCLCVCYACVMTSGHMYIIFTNVSRPVLLLKSPGP